MLTVRFTTVLLVAGLLSAAMPGPADAGLFTLLKGVSKAGKAAKIGKAGAAGATLIVDATGFLRRFDVNDGVHRVVAQFDDAGRIRLRDNQGSELVVKSPGDVTSALVRQSGDRPVERYVSDAHY